jgi:Na+/H+-dicarboxylate symporter
MDGGGEGEKLEVRAVMSPASRVLVALVAGLGLGAAIAAAHVGALTSAVPVIEVAGTLWINAIRMTVIPLVVALTIGSVASSSGAARIGRIGALAVPVFLILLVAGGVLAMVVAPLSLDRLTIPADVAATLRASAGAVKGAGSGAAAQMPSLMQRIIDIVPVNPVKAAADGAILPVVVYSLALGLALRRLAREKREPVVDVVRAISDAMLVLVGWILAIAPVGVFALGLALGARMGVSSAGALLHFIVTLSLTLFVFTLALYPVAALAGRVSPRRFASAAAPAQAVAFSSRSSLAALPAMIAGARDGLGLPPTITGFALPLAVSVFRVNVPIAWVVGVYFLGKLYGIPVSEAQLAMLVVTSTLISFSVPGIPSASLFLLAPVLVDMGLPAEGAGILIAVDAIPDMFKTLANVTSHLTSVTVLARFDERPA